jgi:hypothetical protein
MGTTFESDWENQRLKEELAAAKARLSYYIQKDLEHAEKLDAAKARIERLRGALKTASGRFFELGDTESADDCLEWAGDRERIKDLAEEIEEYTPWRQLSEDNKALKARIAELSEETKEQREVLILVEAALDDVDYSGHYDKGVYALKARIAELEEYKANHTTRNFRVVELVEKVKVQQADIASWVERDFANQRRIAELEAKLRQVQASDEGTEQAEPVAWYYADGESIVTTMINPERELAVPLYTHPPKHEAVEPVAWVYKNKNTDDWYLRWTPVTESGFQQKALYTQPLVATLPHDDSALRELMMRVASETESQCMEAYSCKEDDAPFVTWPLDDDLQDIINRVLGEAK